MAKKITVQMIADAAGYSKYVVSKTLNNKPGVKESTRDKILFVAEQLGYFNNDQQKKNEHMTDAGFVLVIMPDQRYQNIESVYWGKIFDGIMSTLEKMNYGSVVISGKDYLIDKVKGESLLGVITVGHIDTDMLLNLSNLYSVPFVMVDHEDEVIKADRIFMDNYRGMYKLTTHILMLGHEQVCFVGDRAFSPSFKERWMGFREALTVQGCYRSEEECLFNLNYSRDMEWQFRECLEEYERECGKFTAFVCANDEIATKVSKVLLEKGYDIPSDVSVAGFDNIDFKVKNIPPITTVQVIQEAIGQRAVNELIWRLDNYQAPNERIQISGDIIVKKSTAKARK
ncbi:substrate-binding domain-containing protein [Gracilibacillus alcaliphilus]|uniref:substrate-binding domain-containing protein n=1 Tax=Gracilibacillus alcaliphilus TaxID=1401441 RepID=UPI00195CB84E|nr:LacI family transcriptional regulator [Gracilibacillus alcaliphilus]